MAGNGVPTIALRGDEIVHGKYWSSIQGYSSLPSRVALGRHDAGPPWSGAFIDLESKPSMRSFLVVIGDEFAE